MVVIVVKDKRRVWIFLSPKRLQFYDCFHSAKGHNRHVSPYLIGSVASSHDTDH